MSETIIPQANPAMNEAPLPAKKRGFSPAVTYVLEHSLFIARTQGITVGQAASQVLNGTALLNARVSPTTDKSR